MSEQTIVSFPSIGIEELQLNKIAFTLFGKLEVRWYGIIITLGIVLAFCYAMWRGKKYENVVPDDVIDIGLLTVVLGVIGARAYYVLTSLDRYDTFGEAIAIWNGGLGIYGGIIGGCIGILIMCAIKKMSWRKLFDMIAPGVMIAQAMGRWGNFFNGEAYGYAIGDTTRFFFFNKELVLSSGEGTIFHTLRMGLNQYGTVTYYHPTFLYESVWNVLGFVLINLLYKHKRFHGQIALTYFTWYGFGRMFIEGFRTDSLYVPGTEVRISQLLGLLCFLICGTALLVLSIITRKREPLLQTEAAAVAAAGANESTGTPAEETVDGMSAEAAEEAIEETTEGPAEEAVEGSAEETAEEIVEKPTEEPTDGPTAQEVSAEEEKPHGNEN